MVNNGRPWEKADAVSLWMAGRTGDEIAAALSVTRSMVMGYLHRQGLVGDTNPSLAHKALKPKKVLVTKTKKPKTVRVSPPPPPADAPAKKPEELENDVDIKNCSRGDGYHLLELERNQCRFPVSGYRDTYLFCGDTCVSRKSYCKYHLNVMFSKKTTPPLPYKKRKKQDDENNY
jgi:hypothetical protein